VTMIRLKVVLKDLLNRVSAVGDSAAVSR